MVQIVPYATKKSPVDRHRRRAKLLARMCAIGIVSSGNIIATTISADIASTAKIARRSMTPGWAMCIVDMSALDMPIAALGVR